VSSLEPGALASIDIHLLLDHIFKIKSASALKLKRHRLVLMSKKQASFYEKLQRWLLIIVDDASSVKLIDLPTKNAETTANTVNLDLLIAQDIMSKINQSVNDVAIATRIVDGYRNHAEKGAWLTTYASFPFE
jgi:uncharacterized HAD superfamily protein